MAVHDRLQCTTLIDMKPQNELILSACTFVGGMILEGAVSFPPSTNHSTSEGAKQIYIYIYLF